MKGTVQSVIADNLGAYGIAGFIESFPGVYLCRFSTGKRSDIQAKAVQLVYFKLRTKDIHETHCFCKRELNHLLWSKERVCFH